MPPGVKPVLMTQMHAAAKVLWGVIVNIPGLLRAMLSTRSSDGGTGGRFVITAFLGHVRDDGTDR